MLVGRDGGHAFVDDGQQFGRVVAQRQPDGGRLRVVVQQRDLERGALADGALHHGQVVEIGVRCALLHACHAVLGTVHFDQLAIGATRLQHRHARRIAHHGDALVGVVAQHVGGGVVGPGRHGDRQFQVGQGEIEAASALGPVARAQHAVHLVRHALGQGLVPGRALVAEFEAGLARHQLRVVVAGARVGAFAVGAAEGDGRVELVERHGQHRMGAHPRLLLWCERNLCSRQGGPCKQHAK